MVEEHIQAIAERQRHDGRGRVVGRLPATRRAVPVARVRCGKGALRCSRCGRKAPRYDNGGGGRSWRHQDFGCFRVGLSGPVPRVECPSARRGGLPGAVGRAGRPVHPRLRIRVRMADDGRRPEDRERFPAYRVEDRRRHRRTGRRPAGALDAVHVRRVARDRCGRDRPQEGPRVHHRHRRPRARTRDLGARRARQTGPRPVLPTTDAGAARVDPDRDRRRGRTDRLVRAEHRPNAERRCSARSHRLLDDRRARPGSGNGCGTRPGATGTKRRSRRCAASDTPCPGTPAT